MNRPAHVAFCIVAAAFLGSCGAPGIPEPPSLELARPVRDLAAVRKGNEVHLTWSVPTETTDRRAFRHPGQMLVCRRLGEQVQECMTPLAELPAPTSGPVSGRIAKQKPAPAATVPQATYTDRLPANLETQSPIQNVFYAVSVLNSYGRSAGLSNQIQVPSAPTLAAPPGFTVRVEARGVNLEWNTVTASTEIPEVHYEYRVYRRDVQTGKDSIAGEVPVSGSTSPVLLDTTFEWEKTYQYRATVVTLIDQPGGPVQVEGDDTPSTQVFAHDVFPPAIPEGLQAGFSGPGQKLFVDLVWTANTEADLAGYNIHRRESNSAPIRINSELVKTPAFRDPNVEPGHQYSYSVTAVDVRGNESSRSEEASEKIP